jgi:hypothetical protein
MYKFKLNSNSFGSILTFIQGVIEIHGIILATSYWFHVELGKNIKKILCQKINLTFNF